MQKIEYLLMDVDGTLTNGKIYMGNNGEMFKVFDIKDGCGIHDIAIPNGIIPVVITGRRSDIVETRCREMGITEIYQGVQDKTSIVKKIALKCTLDRMAYIGDDLPDLPVMKLIKESNGLIGCPYDAVEKVKDIADFVAQHNGGNGAVRDFIEWIDYGE